MRYKRYMLPEEAGRALHLHANTVRRKCRDGEIPYKPEKRGSKTLYWIPESYVKQRERDRKAVQKSSQAKTEDVAQKVADKLLNRVLERVEEWLRENVPDAQEAAEREATLRRLQDELAAQKAVNERLRSLVEHRKKGA